MCSASSKLGTCELAMEHQYQLCRMRRNLEQRGSVCVCVCSNTLDMPSEDASRRGGHLISKKYVTVIFVYVCMYVCIYIYIYMFIHICIQINTHVSLSPSLSLYIYIYIMLVGGGPLARSDRAGSRTGARAGLGEPYYYYYY